MFAIFLENVGRCSYNIIPVAVVLSCLVVLLKKIRRLTSYGALDPLLTRLAFVSALRPDYFYLPPDVDEIIFMFWFILR